MQNGADNIGSNARLVIFHHGEIEGHDSRILNQNVKSFQALRTLCEVLDRLIVSKIKLPHLDNTGTSCCFLDGSLCRLALFEVANCEDDFGGIETHEVAGCFETEAGVAACDNDGLTGVFLGGVGRDGEELGAQERDGRLYVRHLGGLVLSTQCVFACVRARSRKREVMVVMLKGQGAWNVRRGE